MSERLTRIVLRHRLAVLACWVAVLAGGALASARLPDLLTTSFAVPGTDSARVVTLLARDFDRRSEGSFMVVFDVPRTADTALRKQLQRRLEQAARTVPTGRARPLERGSRLFYGEITTTLELQHAKRWTDPLRAALRSGGGPAAVVTGQPAIQHDLDPVLRDDLRRGEAIALPIALAVLLLVLGLSLAALIPLAFAACTIAGALGLVWTLAHAFSTATYVTNLVELIGLGLAIDYSLLIVYRFREELARGLPTDEAVVRTMATAGRAVVFSGLAVAIGLALLLLTPVPFVRSLGVGGLLVPLVSIAGVLTLQPALLSLLGARGMRRVPVAGLLRHRLGLPLPALPGTDDPDRSLWARLARAIMRRPVAWLALGGAVLVAAAVPAAFLELTPTSLSGLPTKAEAIRGYRLLVDRVGPGAITPVEIVVDSGAAGGARTAPVQAAVDRLADGLFDDGEAYLTASGPKDPYVDAAGRYARIVVVGRHEHGDPATQQLVRRLRSRLVPAARFPDGVRVFAGGAPAQGVDFLDRSYSSFPWLIAAVLVLTYGILLRAFRSLLLPLKAILLNALSVAAAYGLLVVVFRWGVGHDVLGLYRMGEIEGWVPIFLFATLFGLSMDYEVFLVSRMRESWDHVPDNARAVAHGLGRTGRIVTAAAAIMVAAFSGFVGGRIAGLQEFGVGLMLAVVVDATIVRAILVPALMALFGRWNWWLPARIARLARVAPSPLD